ncbi:hypothetical protein [Pseudomonas aeruginosa]|uniref:hypothetical protein n=1 Tax=Pseudomonas aeruginosa TaxID=287 RepID=UPI001C8A7F1C|nr:hypothetical protein [Pseudomonas aeruginosa]
MTKSSNSDVPVLVDESNISCAWAKAVLHVMDHPGTSISPLILSVNNFNDLKNISEVASIREELDKLLLAKGMRSVEDVAFTIFPQRLWKISQGDRAALFRYYKDAFPRYQAMEPRHNRRGLYFERLTGYGSGPCEGNQLEWILSQHHGRDGVRKSMYQASVFDPGRDHVPDAQLEFPCLQHVSFVPSKDGLVINAFYATQQLFVKAYGNYLGIAQLGAFMAQEMGVPFSRMNVVVGVAKFEKINKTDADLLPLLTASRAAIAAKCVASADHDVLKANVETIV